MRDELTKLMSFGDHLDDLRRRLWFAILGPIPIVALALFFGDRLLLFLLKPLEAQLKAADQPARLLATGPAETFLAYLKVAIIAGALVGLPWIIYQLWLFVAPGLYKHERRFAYILLPMSAALTAASAIFLYAALLPIMLRFFIVFGASLAPQSAPTIDATNQPLGGPIPVLRGDPVSPPPGSMWVNETLNELRIAVAPSAAAPPAPAEQPPTDAQSEPAPTAASQGKQTRVRILGAPLAASGMIAQQYRVSEYVNLLFTLGLVFAIAFQLPVVMLLGGWIGALRPEWLKKWRKHIVFGCAVAGALLTPADPISMILLALPLYALFEFGLLLMKLAPATSAADQRADEREGPDAEA